MASSSNTTASDSGGDTVIKRRKIEEKNTTKAIIDKMMNEIASFGALVSITITEEKLEDEDFRRLYRLYLAAEKALKFLDTERDDLQKGIKPMPTDVEKILRPTDDNVMVWSQFFYKNPSPTKLKGMKTAPSPATEKIGGLLHAVASFAGLTAEAVCSSKRKKENYEKMGRLLKVTETAIRDMEIKHDDIFKALQPYMAEKADELQK